MSDLRELYQEVILDHSRAPRNFGSLDESTHSAKGLNPLCGDKLQLYLHIDGGKVTRASFEGQGCAISTASASLLTEIVKDKTTQEALEIFHSFHKAVTTPSDQSVDADGLGKLVALIGVREFPSRVKCASLAWHTMDAALKGEASITTE